MTGRFRRAKEEIESEILDICSRLQTEDSSITWQYSIAFSIGKETECRRSHENTSRLSSLTWFALTASIKAFQVYRGSTIFEMTCRRTSPPQILFNSGACRYRRKDAKGPFR